MSKKSVIMKKTLKFLVIFLIIFSIGGVGGVYFDQQVLPFIRTSKFFSRIDFLKRSAENVTVINKTERVTIKEDDSINEIASQASNAVVNIVSLTQQKDPLLKTSGVTEHSGSGVLVSSDGMIVTYRSAIFEKNSTYQVFLYNGNNYEAKLVGIDEFSDLAYLKIDVPNLTAISFADSANVHPGKKIVAIGNSFGEYQNRYAAGLLSNIAKTYNLAGKTVSSSEKMEGVFESDLNMIPEYIGGPIIGYSGDMIGIIGMQTINGKDQYFQIPSNVVEQSLQTVLQGDLEKRPFFGAYYISITQEYAISKKLSKNKGALIYAPSGKQGLAIISGSVAEQSGLRINDIILAVNEREVNLDDALADLLNLFKKGDKIELTVQRANEVIKIPVNL